MEPNKDFSVNADHTAAGNSQASFSNKPGESFTDEKKSSSKKNAAKKVSQLPAPFYDELHFANYE